MSYLAHFHMLAHYNSLANERLYQACNQLSDAERTQDRKAFFKSIHGTLNHIMIADRLWMQRFNGTPAASNHLDAILYADFQELWQARQEQDDIIESFMQSLTDEFLTQSVTYINNEGKQFSDPAPLLLTHFFNHQTHHRGQIHAMLTQTSVTPPVLDMPRVLKPFP